MVKKLLDRIFKKKVIPPQIDEKLLTISEVTEVFFILVPYIKVVENLINEYKDTKSDIRLFFDVAQSLLEQLNKKDLEKVAAILLGVPQEEAEKKSARDLIIRLPSIIRSNNLLELFYIFKSLGLFD